MKYRLVHSIWYLLSLLPLCVHYILSDLLYVIVYYIVGYRRHVVRKNLTSSFPDKDQRELRQIERGFYHWFCDYIAETIKLVSISEKNIKRRMRFEGMDEINEWVRKGKSVTVYLGHYCNWEWVTSLGLHIVPEGTAAQLYHPLENKLMDSLFLHLRERFGAHSIPMNDAFKVLADWQKQGKYSVTGYIADQVPLYYNSMHYWPWFLNHDTPSFTGPERIARILDTPVYFFDILRPQRGYYVVKAVKICDEPGKMEKFSITEAYYRLLEKSIQRAPSYWLWSHNRWKRNREEFCRLYSEEERKRILSKL